VLRYGRLKPRRDGGAATGHPLSLSAPWFDENELARVREALAGRTAGDGPFCRRVESRLAEQLGVPRVRLTTRPLSADRAPAGPAAFGAGAAG